MATVEDLAGRILAAAGDRDRFIVAVAGPPGSGKSTVVEALLAAIEAVLGPERAVIVPMDGYHYDNAILDRRGERALKGAPHTFDHAGYAADLARIRAGEADVAVPVFDRSLDLARACARLVSPAHRIVLTEGNYLLLDEEPWRGLAGLFDLTVFLDVDDAVLEARLIDRWLAHGRDRSAAIKRATGHDMANARRVKQASRPADIVFSNDG